MARIKLSSRVTIPDSVKEAQKAYRGELKGYSQADALDIYNKVKGKTPTPESLENAKLAYKNARRGIFRKAYFGKLAERTKSLRKDFKLHKALGVLFTLLGTRFISDYLNSRRALRSKLTFIGHTLSVEMARDPKLREAIKTLSKEYPYFSVNRNGEPRVSSFSGSIFDKSTMIGKMSLFNSDYLIPSQLESRLGNKAFRQKLDFKLLFSMGSPTFEAATYTTSVAGARGTPPRSVTAAALGNSEVRIFSRKLVGGKTISEERIILADEVKSKSLINSTSKGKKIVQLQMDSGEIINLELDEKKAKSIHDGLKLE